MSRENSNASTIRTVSLAIALVVGTSLVAYYFLRGPDTGSTGSYFYDMNTKKIFVQPGTVFSPVETPSGPVNGEPAGVRLYIFACQPCKSFAGMTLEEVQAKGAFPVWFEKYTPEAKKMLEEGDKRPEVMLEGVLMRSVKGDRWVTPGSKDAVAMRQSIKELCPGGQATACTP